LFAPAVLALEARDLGQLRSLLAIAEGQVRMQPAIRSAFGWTSAQYLHGTVKELLIAESAFNRGVGITCCAMHGVDPGEALRLAATDADPLLRAQAFRAAGDLGRPDVVPVRFAAAADENPVCRFWAVRSLVLLGSAGVRPEELTGLDASESATEATGFRLGLQAMDVTRAHTVLKGLATDPSRIRRLIQGSGIVGDPAYAPWLIGHMADDRLARAAGEAFTLMTGADLGELGLERHRPEDFDAGPTDDPDDSNVSMDPDADLRWPDQQKVEKWWAGNGSRFTRGERYFMGAPVTREHCIAVLKNGYQRQRILAAHYLCLLEPGTPLFNTSAPAWRQQRLLAGMN
jgi:uncharacterized protein (TIGR02270 family)